MRGLVELVNEFAHRPRMFAGEQDAPYPDVARIDGLPGDMTEIPVLQLVSAANEVYEVFAADSDGRAYEVLNRILRSAAPSPIATARGTRWTVRNARHLVRGAMAVCLLEWLTSHGWQRLGRCHAVRCADVYADASPAGKRRFCSSTCLNRHKVAAHRSRSRRRIVGASILGFIE